MRHFYYLFGLVTLLYYSPTLNAQYSSDDREIAGSLCVGFDCINGENFGFDTFRMKENNLRIHFDDTSNSASFAANDWGIEINSSANGGLNYFSVLDRTGNTNPFRILAGAPTNSLFVNSNGNVGLGIDVAVLELHILDDDTPSIRFEQDNSAGWTPQTWDVSGNESNFFIRDVTNGSTLPFRIQPGSATSSIYIASNGSLGLGTNTPNGNSSLDISGTDEGVLINRLTTAQRTLLATSLSTAEDGLMVYDTELKGIQTWDGAAWQEVSSDNQNISGSNLSGTTLTIGIEGGTSETVDLSSLMNTGTDDQSLTLTNNTLSLEDGGMVDLSGYLDNTDAQTIGTFALSGNSLELNITGGNTVQVDLSPILSTLQGDLEDANAEISTLNTQMVEVLSRLDAIEACACDGTLGIDSFNLNIEQPSLTQNIPNPFDNSTIIGYFIPFSYSNGNIVVSSTSGKILSNHKIDRMGEGSITVNKNAMQAGVYYYSLYVNGKRFDSKKMIVE